MPSYHGSMRMATSPKWPAPPNNMYKLAKNILRNRSLVFKHKLDWEYYYEKKLDGYLSPNIKSSEGLMFPGGHDDLSYNCSSRAFSAPFNEHVNLFLRAGNHGFHITFISIFYPTGNAVFLSNILCRGSKENALYFSFYK